MAYRNFSLLHYGEKKPSSSEVPTARNVRAPKNISDIFVAEIFISRRNGICLLHPKKDYARAALLEIAPCEMPYIMNIISVKNLDVLKLKIKNIPSFMYHKSDISASMCNLSDRVLLAFYERRYFVFAVCIFKIASSQLNRIG